MAGGIGSRFWPMSRTVHPKQFLDILGIGKTLLQLTYHRFLPIIPKENIFVVTNEHYFDLVHKQLPDLPINNIILEPLRKNTAACIAYTNYKIMSINPTANIVVAPSDHLILKEETFIKAVECCFKKSKDEDCLITIGIKPTRPDTGYGYIQFTDSDKPEKDKRIKKVKTFTEKPDLKMAKFFVKSGDFLWNAGIFVWSLKSIMKAYEQFMPEMETIFRDGISLYNTPFEKEYIKEAYILCKNISIDYGILEKAKNVYVRSSIIGWSDLGTYGSLYNHQKHDENDNAVVGKNVFVYQSKNNIINMPKDKVVVIQGVNDCIIVESEGILLVCKKSEEQQIRQFVTEVKTKAGDKFV